MLFGCTMEAARLKRCSLPKCSETSHYLIRELPTTRPVTDTALLPKECHMNNKSQELVRVTHRCHYGSRKSFNYSFGIYDEKGSARSSVVSVLGPGSIPGQSESVMITFSRHLCAGPNMGHARRIRPVLKYSITDLKA